MHSGMRYLIPTLVLLLSSPTAVLRADHHEGELKSHSAITPAPRQGGWIKRHESFNAKVTANQGNIDLAFIGDSITQGWEGRGKVVWEKYYSHRKSLNLGIGGDRTQHVLWRMDNGNLDGIQPKVAVIMIGTNNSADDRNTANEMVDGVRAIVGQLRSKLPQTRLLLLGIFPRGDVFNDRHGKILQVNQALARLHDGEYVTYLDIGHEFMDDNGTISPSIMPDYLHLSSAGYGIWASAIESFLSTHLGDSVITPKNVQVDGDWTIEIEGPDGAVEADLEIKADGPILAGHVAMGPDRILPFKSGGRFENQIDIQIVRDRPDGSNMTYNLTGIIDGDQITGTVSTRLDGERVTQPWSAKRQKP
jgi:lysophospholipase L1-like esterase